MRVPESLRRLAEQQDQLFTRAQAVDGGMSRSAVERRVRAGDLVIVHPGVYRIHPADDTFARRCRAALLAAGPSAALCRRGAAGLLGFPEVEPAVEIAIASERRVALAGVRVMRCRGHLDQAMRVRGMFVHDHARVVHDLAGVLDRDGLERVIDHGLGERWFRIGELDHQFRHRGGKGRKGAAVLRELIEERSDGRALTMSRFEQRLQRLLIGGGLPRPVGQHRVRLPGGATRILDFAYPAAQVYIEAESYRYHASRAAWSKDKVRGNALAGLGWLRIDVTWADLTERPDDVVAWVRAALAARR